MVIKKVQVRTAATLTGTGVTTSAVDIRGARCVVFELKATDTGQLSGALISVSNDGTNWVDTSSSVPANGKSNAVMEGVAITLALNAGPALLTLIPFGQVNTMPLIVDGQARLKIGTAGSVAGLEAWAYVYYDGDNPRMVTGDKTGVGPALL